MVNLRSILVPPLQTCCKTIHTLFACGYFLSCISFFSYFYKVAISPPLGAPLRADSCKVTLTLRALDLPWPATTTRPLLTLINNASTYCLSPFSGRSGNHIHLSSATSSSRLHLLFSCPVLASSSLKATLLRAPSVFGHAIHALSYLKPPCSCLIYLLAIVFTASSSFPPACRLISLFATMFKPSSFQFLSRPLQSSICFVSDVWCVSDVWAFFSDVWCVESIDFAIHCFWMRLRMLDYVFQSTYCRWERGKLLRSTQAKSLPLLRACGQAHTHAHAHARYRAKVRAEGQRGCLGPLTQPRPSGVTGPKSLQCMLARESENP